jgi:multidrug efflux pump subunit AcrA (membrane-fusion protein)
MARKHRILWIAGAGVGAFAAYHWIYKPWAASRDAALAAGGQVPSLFPFSSASALPPPAAMVSAPAQITPSNLNPGAAVGGVVGACMTKKGNTWTQGQCQARLDALVSAARNATAAIAQLQNGVNPAAGGIVAAQAQLAAEQAALDIATQNYNAAAAAGNTNDAATWHAAVLAHQSDIADLNNRIAAAQAPANNAAAISAYQGQLAANDNDYFNLTGVHLLSSL